MSQTPATPSSTPDASASASPRRGAENSGKGSASMLARGEPMVFMTGAALALALMMIVFILALIFFKGFSTFWPKPLVESHLIDGSVVLGEPADSDIYTLRFSSGVLTDSEMHEDLREDARQRLLDALETTVESRLSAGLYAEGLDDTAHLLALEALGAVEVDESYYEEPEFIVHKTLAEALLERRDVFRSRFEEQLSASSTGEEIYAWYEETQTAGQSVRRDSRFFTADDFLLAIAEAAADEEDTAYALWAEQVAQVLIDSVEVEMPRTKFRTGNYELTGQRFTWVFNDFVEDIEIPMPAVKVERMEAGPFYGFPVEYVVEGEVEISAVGLTGDAFIEASQQIEAKFSEIRDEVQNRRDEITAIQKHDIGHENSRMERARLRVVQEALDHGYDSPEHLEAQSEADAVVAEAEAEIAEFTEQIEALREINERQAIRFLTATGLLAMNEAEGEEAAAAAVAGYSTLVPFGEVNRVLPYNGMGVGEKLGYYTSRWWEFLIRDPRRAGQEGGVWPALFGTVLMTMIMCVLVVPFGVMSALYLREYAKAGPLISVVRISINNLAGVPSIVFGVFGYGFFILIVGGWLDGGPEKAFSGWKMPSAIWLILLVIITVLSALAFAGWLWALNKKGHHETAGARLARQIALGTWVFSAAVGVLLIAGMPWFEGFFQARLEMKSPTFGKGALVWASFTLALLTLPVVIVATEEALAAVPNSMREGSYGCGASKWQTIQRIVLPRALPGIMTGAILAMARGAGEVAPLMIVGVVKLAPELPLSSSPHEQFGINRSFMHLGFHIYDLGFQSPDSEAARPMVFTTTLLLILLVFMLNVTAITLRTRLRKKFEGSAF